MNQQIPLNETDVQMKIKSIQTSLQDQLRDLYDVNTRYIIFPLGHFEDQDVQSYTFNIFNQYLNQNLSFCEITEPLRNYKQREKYFAKLQPEVNPILVLKIVDNILIPIREHINKYTEKDRNLDILYNETMILIKRLNAIKIE